MGSTERHAWDQLTEPERDLVIDWIEDRSPDLPDDDERRRLVLTALGYSTPSHLAMFGL